MLALLRAKQINKARAKRMEEPLTGKEISEAIGRQAKGKSPGPDHLPAELYKDFEHLVAQPLLDTFTEAHDKGSLVEALRQGDVTLHYKKGDPREIRNYRPITLLNVDYKILAHVLVKRLKTVMDDIISKEQLGFVPGREISESTLFLKLVQAKLEEDDLEGIIVACDWEKAFDRVSWDYPHQATEALGFRPYMCSWLKVLYNTDAPPQRCIKSNGSRSDPFPILSGVPQGCPASPIIFLLVAEALARAIVQDPKIKGIQIAGKEYKLTQFADDTQILLAGYKYLKRLWAVLTEYEDATGMKANAKKFEGLRCGALVRKPIPLVPELRTEVIKWVEKGDYVRILGIPFWESNQYDINIFYDTLYRKHKSLLAAWKDHHHLTIVGRGMLINSMVYGRFRYYIQVEPMPQRLVDAIVADVQALAWGKEVDFDPEEEGTRLANRRFMINEAQHLPRKGTLGAGILNWEKHVQALLISKLLKYRDGAGGQWKELLDSWLDRESSGRGAIFATHRLEDLIQSTHSSSAGESKLPRIWKHAIRALQTLQLRPADPTHWSADTARAMPVWYNPLFKIPKIKHEEFWRQTLRMNTIKDMVNDDMDNYSEEEVRSEIARLVTTEGSWTRVKSKEWVKTETLLKEWRRVMAAIPERLLAAAREEVTIRGYSFVSQRIMFLMGWAPGMAGIGKRGQGRPEPVPAGVGQTDTAGLGMRPRPKARAQKPDKPLVAVCLTGEVVYGKLEGQYLRVHDLNVKGRPEPTKRTLLTTGFEIRRVIKWGEGVAGIAESFFPCPKEWRLGDINKPLDKITVKDLTGALTRAIAKPPSCFKKWQGKFPGLDLRGVSERYSIGIVTPVDFGSHNKLIIHSGFLTNPHNPDAISPLCRLCGQTRESIEHWGECPTLEPIYSALREIDGGARWDDCCLNLFGQHGRYKAPPPPPDSLPMGVSSGGQVIAPGLSLVHFITWKFMLIHMTLLSLKKQPFFPTHVLAQARRRIKRKLEGTKEGIRICVIRADAKEQEPKLHQYRKWLRGIGYIRDNRYMALNEGIEEWLNADEPPD